MWEIKAALCVLCCSLRIKEIKLFRHCTVQTHLRACRAATLKPRLTIRKD